MLDVRWFTETAHGGLIVPHLHELGLSVAQTGDAPARLVVGFGNTVAATAWQYATKHQCPLVQFIWDLPPWRLGAGRYDPVWSINGRLLHVPRLGRRYRQRAKLYSCLRYVAAHADTVWLPSLATAADVRDRFGVRGDLIHYCYDSDRFTPGNVRARQPVLLSVSRLVPSKNHEAVIRAGHRFKMPVRIIGPGALRGSLERLAYDLRVPCTIEDGWLTDEAIVSAYREAAAVVCPSRFEGMGLSGLEGAACGTPVVASDISPHREFLGNVAHFFTLDDDDSLDRAVNDALNAPPPSASQIDRFSLEAAARRYYQHITKILA